MKKHLLFFVIIVLISLISSCSRGPVTIKGANWEVKLLESHYKANYEINSLQHVDALFMTVDISYTGPAGKIKLPDIKVKKASGAVIAFTGYQVDGPQDLNDNLISSVMGFPLEVELTPGYRFDPKPFTLYYETDQPTEAVYLVIGDVPQIRVY